MLSGVQFPDKRFVIISTTNKPSNTYFHGNAGLSVNGKPALLCKFTEFKNYKHHLTFTGCGILISVALFNLFAVSFFETIPGVDPQPGQYF